MDLLKFCSWATIGNLLDPSGLIQMTNFLFLLMPPGSAPAVDFEAAQDDGKCIVHDGLIQPPVCKELQTPYLDDESDLAYRKLVGV